MNNLNLQEIRSFLIEREIECFDFPNIWEMKEWNDSLKGKCTPETFQEYKDAVNVHFDKWAISELEDRKEEDTIIEKELVEEKKLKEFNMKDNWERHNYSVIKNVINGEKKEVNQRFFSSEENEAENRFNYLDQSSIFECRAYNYLNSSDVYFRGNNHKKYSKILFKKLIILSKQYYNKGMSYPHID